MGITDKTRKLLWGRSGNRCAMCKRELVVDASATDDESIVGDECHIISGKSNGPRYDPKFPKSELNLISNLILLCRVHHKQVDDQQATFTIDKLRQIKANHEKWVSESLSNDNGPVRLVRVKENIPKFLLRLGTGREVLNIMNGAFSLNYQHDELHSPDEVELVSEFLQILRDLLDFGSELEPTDIVHYGYDLSRMLENLEECGLLVFGATEIRLLEGGKAPPENWPVATIGIYRNTNEGIISFEANPSG